MANTRAANVIRVDTTAAFSGPLFVQSIKYIGSSSASATVRSGSASGNTLWQESGASNVHNADVCLKAGDGLHVTITNSSVVYLYLK